MTKVVVSRAVRSQLHNLDCHLELCDEDGQLLGYFVPAMPHDEALYARARALFTEEEVTGARDQTDGITTAELLKRLEAQVKSHS